MSAGIFTLSLLAAVLPSMSDGRAARASATAGHATPSRAAASPTAGSVRAAPDSDAGVATGTGTCRPVAQSSGYVNPLAAATVTPERIDQGVDYAGSGTLTAIGAVTVTYVSTSDTGWPGAFIEYQLLGGPDVGCYVFYAEGVRPAPGLRVGETVRAGQTLANIIPHYSSGIEIGWGAGVDTKTYAATVGTWTASDDADNVATAAGKSFSALIAVLGGPPGKVEG